MHQLLFFIMLTIVVPVSQAGKLYKIVNEDGSISFSQFAPDSSKTNKIVEEKVVKTGGETLVTMKGLISYCGQLKLSSELTEKEVFYTRVGQSLSGWKRSLSSKAKELRSNRENYRIRSSHSGSYQRHGNNTSGYLEGNRKITRSMSDLRCAISWGEKKMQSSHEVRKSISGELNELQLYLTSVERKSLNACGGEPKYRPDDAGYQDDYREWSKCSKAFAGKIRGLKRRIRDESRKLGYMN